VTFSNVVNEISMNAGYSDPFPFRARWSERVMFRSDYQRDYIGAGYD